MKATNSMFLRTQSHTHPLNPFCLWFTGDMWLLLASLSWDSNRKSKYTHAFVISTKRIKSKAYNQHSPSSPSPPFRFDFVCDGGGLRIEVGTRPSCTTCSRNDDELSDVLDTLLLVDVFVTKRTKQNSGAPTQFVSMTSTCCPFCTLSSALPCAAAKSATTHVVSTIPV